MPLLNAQDSALDDWIPPSGDQEIVPPVSGAREIRRGGLFARLAGAGERLREAVLRARRDPEPRALREAAEVLERDGGVVFAELDGWPRPPVVAGFVPDVYAVFEDREIVLSFVNEESVQREAARQKDRAYTAWAGASTLRIYEQILVEGGRGGRG